MIAAIALDLSTDEQRIGAALSIWQHTVLERLIFMLHESSRRGRKIKIKKSDFNLLPAALQQVLSKYSETVDEFETSDHILPANLVCSTKFLTGYLNSKLDFAPYSDTSPYEHLLCNNISDVSAIQHRLFHDAKKTTDGWVATHLNAKISIPISRWLARFSIHPNLITLLNLPFVLSAPLFFIPNSYFATAVSGILFQLSSVFDGCDGEVARTKLQVTKRGGWLDTAMDNLSYLLFFVSVGIWKWKSTNNPLFAIGYFSILILLLVALLSTYFIMSRQGTQTHHAYRGAFITLSKKFVILRYINKLNILSRREYFALLIMVLSLLNLKNVIYWGSLCGILIYSIAVIGIFPKLRHHINHEGGVICQE